MAAFWMRRAVGINNNVFFSRTDLAGLINEHEDAVEAIKVVATGLWNTEQERRVDVAGKDPGPFIGLDSDDVWQLAPRELCCYCELPHPSIRDCTCSQSFVIPR